MPVEAATVVFGKFKGTDGRDGRALLENFLKKYCLDYRLRSDNGTYSVDMLFFKPVDRYWLTNRPSVYASRWGFGRSTWDRDNTKPLTKEEYLQGPTPIVAGKAMALLAKIYKKTVDQVVNGPIYRTMGTGRPFKQATTRPVQKKIKL